MTVVVMLAGGVESRAGGRAEDIVGTRIRKLVRMKEKVKTLIAVVLELDATSWLWVVNGS